LKTFLKYFSLIILPLNIYSQCFYYNSAFSNGEILEYDVKYTLGFLWFDAGYVIFKVDSILQNNEYVYKFSSIGSSLPKYDWIFKVREFYESYAFTSPLKPISYKRNSIEGNYFATEEYTFDYSKKKTFSKIHNSKTKLRYDTLTLPDCAYDLLTAIYAFRNIDFSKIKPNEKIYINVIIDNNWERQYLRMIGKENLKIGGKIYECYRLKAYMLEGTIFSGGEKTDIWITTSKEHIPVYIEAEILVGTVRVYLKNYTKK
jgi:hypothetical protein